MPAGGRKTKTERAQGGGEPIRRPFWIGRGKSSRVGQRAKRAVSAPPEGWTRTRDNGQGRFLSGGAAEAKDGVFRPSSAARSLGFPSPAAP